MGERIVIIGNAGGGKSRLARGLAIKTGLPLYQLDLLQWNPGWIATPEADFRDRHDAAVAGERWIVDGVASWSSIAHRLECCDTVIFVDLPLWQHYWWAAKRQLASIARPRPDFVPDCPMLPMTWRLARMMWWLHRDLRPKLVSAIDQYRGVKHLYVLRSAKELNDFAARYAA